MKTIVLSVLTPAVPSRFEKAQQLAEKLALQITDLPVEHLILLDNKRRTVGEKRDALLRISKGKYISYVDDDDDVSSDYVLELLIAAKQDPDVITFRQLATVDDQSAIVEFKLGNPHEQYHGEKWWDPKIENADLLSLPTIRRDAAHLCAWRRVLALQSKFPPINYGEDYGFSVPLCHAAKTEVYIDKVLHHYRHSIKTTEAPPGS